MSTSKRRLEMMPEVLPAPVKRDATTSSVRSRTLARLKVLAALTVSGIAASCGGRASDDGTTPGGGGGDAGLPDGGKKQDCDPYCVVDPLPPPSCFDYGKPPTATARYATSPTDGDGGVDAGADAGTDGGAARDVVLDLDFHTTAVALGTIDTFGLAEVVSQNASTMDGTATLVLRIKPGVSRLSLSVRVSCAKGPSTVDLTLVLQSDVVGVTVNAR